MEWSNLYGPNNQPTLENISEYINNELWEKLNSFLQNTYDDVINLIKIRVKPKPDKL